MYSGGIPSTTGLTWRNWLLPIIILFPPLTLASGFPAVRAEYVFLYFFIIGALCKHDSGRKAGANLDSVALVIALMMLSCTVSIAVSVMIMGASIVINDWFILIQLVLYYTIFSVAKSARLKGSVLSRIYNLLCMAGIIVGIFSILQYFDVLDINRRVLLPLYFDSQDWLSTSVGLLVQGSNVRRVIGTLGNPNYCGMLFAILWAAVTSFYLYPVRRKIGVCVLVAAGIGTAALIVLTGSRTAVLSFAVVTGAALILGRADAKKRKLFLAVLLGVGLAGLLLMQSWSLGRLVNPANYTSVSAHLILFETTLEQIGRSPIVGLGPQKIMHSRTVDNEFLLYARRYGLVGLGLLLALHWIFFARGWAMFRAARSSLERNLGLLAIQMALVWAIFGLTSDLFKNPQMMGIILFLSGLAWARMPSETSLELDTPGQDEM